MRSYKKILFALFLCSQAIVAVSHIVLDENRALHKQIDSWQRYVTAAIGLLFIFVELRYWNDKGKQPTQDVGGNVDDTYKSTVGGKWFAIFLVGFGIAVTGLLMMVFFHFDFYGNIAANLGVLIIPASQYFLMTKSAALNASRKES
ncbi:hypothetical protein [Dyadobacter diqingensis]|uniref:hypothetical protein n=1 Tax=Dyadobacter diqingensis TaxID=2938121 RepID=UPI0020C27A5D|nr:hypothetical protein [Dyadobacter diqingensis]